MRCLSHVLLGMQTQNLIVKLTLAGYWLELLWDAKKWELLLLVRFAWRPAWFSSRPRSIEETLSSGFEPPGINIGNNNRYYKYSQKYVRVSVLNVNVFFNLLGSFLRMYMMVRTVMEWTAGREGILVRCRRRTWSWSWPEKKRTFSFRLVCSKISVPSPGFWRVQKVLTTSKAFFSSLFSNYICSWNVSIVFSNNLSY
jgi:hypothetical protein